MPPQAEGYDPRPGLVEHRLLQPLVEFGLARERVAEHEGEKGDFPDWMPAADRRLYRKAPLFDRFLTFRTGDARG